MKTNIKQFETVKQVQEFLTIYSYNIHTQTLEHNQSLEHDFDYVLANIASIEKSYKSEISQDIVKVLCSLLYCDTSDIDEQINENHKDMNIINHYETMLKTLLHSFSILSNNMNLFCRHDQNDLNSILIIIENKIDSYYFR